MSLIFPVRWFSIILISFCIVRFRSELLYNVQVWVLWKYRFRLCEMWIVTWLTSGELQIILGIEQLNLTGLHQPLWTTYNRHSLHINTEILAYKALIDRQFQVWSCSHAYMWHCAVVRRTFTEIVASPKIDQTWKFAFNFLNDFQLLRNIKFKSFSMHNMQSISDKI